VHLYHVSAGIALITRGSSPHSALCRYFTDQFKSIGENQGVAFSGRCGPPQPILKPVKLTQRVTGELELPIYSLIRPIQIPAQRFRTIPSDKSRRTAVEPRRGRSSFANGLATV
jgi:hypothetical protein